MRPLRPANDEDPLVQNIGGGIIALLIGYPLLLAAGQILFKRTASRLVGLAMPEQLVVLVAQPPFYATCVLYAAATVLWVWLLTRIPLSAAYRFVGLSFIVFVVVPVAGWWFLGEPLGLRYWTGIGLIVAGVGVIAEAGASNPPSRDPPASAFSDPH
jgi:multidrug transporter EmrE-like cation transporter